MEQPLDLSVVLPWVCKIECWLLLLWYQWRMTCEVSQESLHVHSLEILRPLDFGTQVTLFSFVLVACEVLVGSLWIYGGLRGCSGGMMAPPFNGQEGISGHMMGMVPLPPPAPGSNPPCSTLFIANLGPSCTEEELSQLLSRYPGFSKLKYQMKAGQPVAFVEFQDIRCSTQALSALQNSKHLPAVDRGGMRVEYAKAKMGQPRRDRVHPWAGGIWINHFMDSLLGIEPVSSLQTLTNLQTEITKKPGDTVLYISLNVKPIIVFTSVRLLVVVFSRGLRLPWGLLG